MVYQTNKRFTDIKRCNYCSREGHFGRNCPEVKCRSCGSFGHRAKDCTRKLCYKCSEIGHISTECTKEMSRTCWTCGSRRSEAYISRLNKTIYYCANCKKGDTSIRLTKNLDTEVKEEEEEIPFWTQQDKIVAEMDPHDKKMITGELANYIFSSNFDIMDDILNILKDNAYENQGHEDFKNMCEVNRFLRYNFKGYWKRDHEHKKEMYRKIVTYIPGGIGVERLGFKHVRCETCKNFRGSRTWERKHYYTMDNNAGYTMIYDYRKDYAYFKLYTEEEKKNIEKIIAEDQDLIQFNQYNEKKCIC